MSEIYINFKLISNFYRTSIFYSQLCYLYYVSQPYIFIFTDLQHVSNPGLVSHAVLGGSPATSVGGHPYTGRAVSGGMLVSSGNPAAS